MILIENIGNLIVHWSFSDEKGKWTSLNSHFFLTKRAVLGRVIIDLFPSLSYKYEHTYNFVGSFLWLTPLGIRVLTSRCFI